MARMRKTSTNRVLVDLIQTGLRAKQAEREHFLDVADRFRKSCGPAESDRLREELARLIFDE